MTDKGRMPVPPVDDAALNAYLDGELDAESRQRVEEYLRTDEAARYDLVQFRIIADTLSTLPQFSPPHTFQLDQTHARSVRNITPLLRALPFIKTLSVAAVIAFLVVTSAFFVNQTDDSGDQNVQESAMLAPTTDAQAKDDGTENTAQTSETTEDETTTRRGVLPPPASDSESESPIDRGDAASADSNVPMAAYDLAPTEVVESSDSMSAVASTPPTTPGPGAPIESEPVDNSEDDNGPLWLYTSIGLGVLAIVLIGLWITLTRLSRSRPTDTSS